MNSGFRGEHIVLGVYDPVYNPHDVYQGLLAAGSSTVGPGVEYPNTAKLPQTGAGFVSPVAVDVSAHAIKLTFPAETQGQSLPPDQYDGYVLAFKGSPTEDISSIRILSTNISGINRESVQFNAHQIFINGSGVTLPAGQTPYLTLGVRFSGSDANAAHIAARSLVMGE